MIYAVIALAVIVLALIALIAILEHAHSQERSTRASAYEGTLQTMADRVQAPERLPIRDTVELQIPERVSDEYAQVGSIDIADDYGLGDD
jgi:Tfp pilus assembly protein PilV